MKQYGINPIITSFIPVNTMWYDIENQKRSQRCSKRISINYTKPKS